MASALTVQSVQTQMRGWITEYNGCLTEMNLIRPDGRPLNPKTIQQVQGLFDALDLQILKQVDAIDKLPDQQKPDFALQRVGLGQMRTQISTQLQTLLGWLQHVENEEQTAADKVCAKTASDAVAVATNQLFGITPASKYVPTAAETAAIRKHVCQTALQSLNYITATVCPRSISSDQKSSK